MRNKFRTYRKKSTKPLSKNKLRRRNNATNESLFEFQRSLQHWFMAYMEQLRAESKSVNLPTLSRAKAAN